MEVFLCAGMVMFGVYFAGEVLLAKPSDSRRQLAGKPGEEGDEK